MSPETAEAPFTLKALESKAVRATFWTAIEYGSTQVLRVVNSLVLTHLLLPAYFGEITLVTTFIVGITLISDIGIGQSVIQSPRGDDPHFLNTAWTLQAIRGVLLWCISSLICWPIAAFYHDPRLKILLPILSLNMILTGFNSTNLLTLSRHMGVRRLFGIDFSTQIVTMIVTVTWAYFWPSVWAIVAGTMLSNVYRLILSHNRSVAPGIKNSFRWEKESLHSIIHFGKWILLGTAFFFFASQADRLILGKLVGLTLLGVYGVAASLSDIPRTVIQSLGQRVGYPFIAKMIHLPQEEFRKKFLHYRRYALLGGAFLLSIMAVWGDQLIVHLYDHRYRDAAWMIPILALGLWHTLLYTTTSPVLFSLGKSKYNAVGNAAYCTAMLLGIPLAFHFYGMIGAVIAVAAGDFPLYVVTQFGATREGVRPLWQDLQLTVFFVGLLMLWLFLRRSF